MWHISFRVSLFMLVQFITREDIRSTHCPSRVIFYTRFLVISHHLSTETDVKIVIIICTHVSSWTSRYKYLILILSYSIKIRQQLSRNCCIFITPSCNSVVSSPSGIVVLSGIIKLVINFVFSFFDALSI